MRRLQTGRQVALTLFETEDAIDDALASTAGFIVRMRQARKDHSLPVVIGADAMVAAAAAIQTLAEARAQIVVAHADLAKAQEHLGLGSVRLAGPLTPKPEDTKGALLAANG